MNLEQFENEMDTGSYVLDFRTGNEFAEAFVPGAFYMSNAFMDSGLVHDVISANETLVLVTPVNGEEQCTRQLHSANYSMINGSLAGGFEPWRQSGNKIDVVVSIEADELIMDMKFDAPQVIDIRSEEDYRQGHFDDAENIPAQNLLLNLEELPQTGTYYLYCQDGEFSLSVISCLKNQGLHNFYHIKGGYRQLTVSS